MKHAFPESSGFSHRNLGYMKAFAQAYEDLVFLQEILVYIPWGHHIQLLHRVKDLKKREFYLRGTLEYGWSRNVLLFHVDNHLYERKGKALTNFTKTLPPPQSDLAQQILKDPYNFSFLSLEKEAKERDIEQALMKHVERFLLELGTGFALVGRQYRIEVGEKEYAIDLLFYHLNLRCFVVVELKGRDFMPEDVGQLNFYVSVVDDRVRKPQDQPTIGMILCKGKDKVVAEYALAGIKKPLGISTYDLEKLETLPEYIQSQLPSVEKIEQELSDLEEVEGS